MRKRAAASGKPTKASSTQRASKRLARPGIVLDSCRKVFAPNFFAEKMGGALGPFALQAAIAACHARASTAEETDWARIAALYELLGRVIPSPVVELNRAVAISMAEGPGAGLEIVDELKGVKSLDKYHLLYAVRGDLLMKLGRLDEARAEFLQAASLTRNVRERELLLSRARSNVLSD